MMETGNNVPVIRDTSKRRQQISVQVREHGSVQVARLAEKFGVSSQTIRKDLHYLAGRGVAERAYGGAIATEAVTVLSEAPVALKRAMLPEEKTRIGRFAAAMVAPGDSIVLDSGTTALQIAHHLPDQEDVTVLTNDLDIVAALANRERLKVVMLGGTLRRRNMAFYGEQTMAALEDLHVDKLFLGVDGFDIARGITTHYEPEAMLNRKMVKAARQVIAVADHSKFGRVCLHRIIHVAEIHDLVTDAAPEETTLAGQRHGFRVHIA